MISLGQAALLLVCALGIGAPPQQGYSPARCETGAVPALPAMVVGGGQVILEVTIDPTGHVVAVVPLRVTAPFTELVADAVRGWRFMPARQPASPAGRGNRESGMIAVDAKVLVVGVFRPPAVNAPTLGESPKDLAAASDEVAFPLTISVPPFPPSAAGAGVVLLEARVDRGGIVTGTALMRSAPPFDRAAQAALQSWKFRPGRVRGIPTSTFVYVLFGFPMPVSISPEVARENEMIGTTRVKRLHGDSHVPRYAGKHSIRSPQHRRHSAMLLSGRSRLRPINAVPGLANASAVLRRSAAGT